MHVRGKEIFCECTNQDMYAAIDGVVDKLDRQVIKYKDRAHAHPHDALKHRAEP
jgi:putative sigma-54 modulation protein